MVQYNGETKNKNIYLDSCSALLYIPFIKVVSEVLTVALRFLNKYNAAHCAGVLLGQPRFSTELLFVYTHTDVRQISRLAETQPTKEKAINSNQQSTTKERQKR